MNNITNLTPEERAAAVVKSNAKKRRIKQCINKTSVTSSLQRMREPNEVPNIRTAIKWKCMDCMGWESDGCGSLMERIRQCECPHCPLYPWRGGKFDESIIDGETWEAEDPLDKPWEDSNG